MPATKRKAKCIIRGCTKDAYSRGLCPACLDAAYKVIRQRKATEQELIDRKLMLPRNARGRKRGDQKTKFAKALAKKESAA